MKFIKLLIFCGLFTLVTSLFLNSRIQSQEVPIVPLPTLEISPESTLETYPTPSVESTVVFESTLPPVEPTYNPDYYPTAQSTPLMLLDPDDPPLSPHLLVKTNLYLFYQGTKLDYKMQLSALI